MKDCDPTVARFDQPECDRALEIFMPIARAVGGCLELCGIGAHRKDWRIVPSYRAGAIVAGWFDSEVSMRYEARGFHGISAYFTANPVIPELMARKHNALAAAKSRTKDSEIICWSWLLLDFDPIRPDGISSTPEELEAAIALRDHTLDAEGWAAHAVKGITGNGTKAYIRLDDLPNDPATRQLVSESIDILSARHSTEIVEIDVKTKNPARLMAMPGTVKCKGESTVNRPHRVVRIEHDGPAPPPLRLAEWRAAQPSPPPTAAQPKGKGKVAVAIKGGDGAAHPGTDRRRLIDRARKYLASLAPAIAGNDGHGQAFDAACSLVKGFGLTVDEAYPLMLEWNATCQPPWTDQEILHKLTDADRKADDKPRGWLALAPRDDARSSAIFGQDGGDGTPPPIVIRVEEHEVVNEAIERLAFAPDVYQRANRLVRILRDPADEWRILRRPGTPRIVTLAESQIRDLLTKHASWVKAKGTGDEVDFTPAHPPNWVAPILAGRGEWPGVRVIEAVIEAPTILPGGRVLVEPGWDRGSGLVYEPAIDFPPMPREPTREDARRAAEDLFELVADFPFAEINGDGGRGHRAGWLAALLTPLARFLIDGPCPLFLFDANVAGSGKSRLCDLIAIVAGGREMVRTAYPDTNEEMRKRITCVAIAGDRMVLFDNLRTAGAIGCEALDAALTGTTWTDRLLGKSEMSPEMPLHTVWYATGNNLGLRGDALRRVIPVRLESREERPEERDPDSFRHPDLLGYARANRGRLVVAALTILAAHQRAGRPRGGSRLKPMDYPAWCESIREAVHWATGDDPAAGRAGLADRDPAASRGRAIVEGWAALKEGRTRGLTVRAMLKELAESSNENQHEGLRDALMELSSARDGGLPGPQVIGMFLKSISGRNFRGLVLTSEPYQGTKIWKVEEVRGPEATPDLVGPVGPVGLHHPSSRAS